MHCIERPRSAMKPAGRRGAVTFHVQCAAVTPRRGARIGVGLWRVCGALFWSNSNVLMPLMGTLALSNWRTVVRHGMFRASHLVAGDRRGAGRGAKGGTFHQNTQLLVCGF